MECLFLNTLFIAALAAMPAGTQISAATKTADGVLVHQVRCIYQEGTTQIRVLVPESPQPGERYPVVYVLPVEAKTESRYGDGLSEAIKLKLHERHRAVFVAPTFSQLPWYSDHPTATTIRQESYLLEVVLPFIDATYPVQTDRDHRLLIGFSKSGWGAWSLLLRHPDTFGRAAAWDAPLMMDQLGKYGTTPIFGTQENLEPYKVSTLLRERAGTLRTRQRLVLTGYGNFRPDHVAAHELLNMLGIPHIYRDGPQRKHDWHSGWLEEAVDLLFQPQQP